MSDETESDTVEIGIADNCLVYDRRPLLGASLSASKIIQPT